MASESVSTPIAPGATTQGRGLRAARALAVLASCFAAVTCDLVTSPGEGETTITVTFLGDTVLVVGTVAPIRLEIADQGTVIEGLRYTVTSSDLAVVAPNATGDSLRVNARGSAIVTFTLVGSTFGENPPRGDVRIQAIAASAELDQTTILLQALNDSVILDLEIRDARGDTLVVPGADVEWSSSDADVATVNSRGRVLATGNGTATITAEVQHGDTVEVSATATVTVRQRLDHYTFTPASVVLGALGDTLTVVPRPRDVADSIITGVTLPTPTLTSSRPGFSVTAQGLITALANDTGFVVAEADLGGGTFVRDSVRVQVGQVAAQVLITNPDPVTVTAIPDTIPLSAIVRDSGNNNVLGRSVVWNNLDPLVVGFAPSGNQATAFVTGTGTGRIVAAMDARADTLTFIVTNVSTRIRIRPDTLAFRSVGDTIALTDTVRNDKGVQLFGTVLTYRVLDATIADVTAQGRVVALAVGTTEVIAALPGGQADTSVVSVENRPVTVNIDSTSITLASVGDTITATADIRNQRGAPLGPTFGIDWTSSDSAVAGVSTSGLVTARGAGSATIRATNKFNTARFDEATVTVTNAPAVLTLNRTADALNAPSLTIQYVATVRNARGAVIGGAVVAWRSTNATVADVDPNGLATALAEGASSIVAEIGVGAGLRADTATLTVRNDAVSMTLSQTSAIIGSIGDTLRLFADVRNTVGGTVGNVQLDWSSTDTVVASVDTLGLITARSVGTSTVTSRLRNTILSAGAQIEVRNAPDTVIIFPTSVTLASVLDQDTPAVRLRNALGDSLARGAAQWLSDDATIAQVSGDGVITAIARGLTKV
ncbi:MAG: Ig-like domain-containing protein, partial [Gemmatimonadetes bacterium]|nr:Ig-like domain-containing protein [Gemmatimonadota bacterium]